VGDALVGRQFWIMAKHAVERDAPSLEGARFDEFVEGVCARFYHARLGRPSLRPGIYFRALLVGYFEGDR